MFFPPFVMSGFPQKPLICYTDDSVSTLPCEGFSENDAAGLLLQISTNMARAAGRELRPILPEDTDFVLGFLWVSAGQPFLDAWIQRQLDSYGPCGPMTSLVTFDGYGQLLPSLHEKGNACGNTRIVSGCEEAYRRLVMAQGGSLEDYINGPRPQMPEGFIVPWPNPS